MLALGRIIARGRRYIAEVDGLRFVAIIAVVLFHLNGYTLQRHMQGAAIHPYESWLAKVLTSGRYGVQLFFVLSGFLLAMPFAKWRLGLGPRPLLRNYYIRRLTRLEPPYIIAALLTFISGLWAFGFQVGLSHWPNLLASLIYQHNLIFGQGSLISIVFWSLEIEVQFYLLAPFLSVVFSISDVLVRRGVLLMVIIVNPLLVSLVPPLIGGRWNSLLWYLELFATGFLLTDIYLVDWKENPPHSSWWDLATLVGWPALALLLISNPYPVLIAPLILLTYMGAFRGRLSSWFFRHRSITLVGGMCYSIYLLHYSVISFTGRLSARILIGSNYTTRLLLDCLIVLPVVFGVSLVFYLLIERPCMNPEWPRLLHVRWRQWSSGSVAAVEK